ncbi:response regulator [Flavobacterium sp. W1B]|uniref:response regulator n=1 Tax=Flavobacterium sp. W1B TaxID=3394146 RepID=UPI0039BC2F17
MNILLVDDHPMTVQGYENALMKCGLEKVHLNFQKAYSCEEAYHSIMKASSASPSFFDLAIIDRGLPGYEEQSLSSGGDLALFIRKEMPGCKIIMVTAHTEIIIIYEISRKIQPEGLIIKNDITPDNIVEIVTDVMKGNKYQSPLVKKCITDIWKRELMVEDHNRQILMFMSKGFKIKELEKIINISGSAIQKRIIKMKIAFDVTEDSSLVKEAIKQGFV